MCELLVYHDKLKIWHRVGIMSYGDAVIWQDNLKRWFPCEPTHISRIDFEFPRGWFSLN